MAVSDDPITRAEDWLKDPVKFRGSWQGGSRGAGISVIASRIDGPGGGPRLHRHPYPETFVIQTGVALFTVGGCQIEARAGEIVVAPANTPHKFENRGPGPLESLNIHESGKFATEWLE